MTDKVMAQTIANIYKKKILKETVDIPVSRDATGDANTVMKTLAENIALKYEPP